MRFSDHRILCIDDDTNTVDWIRIVLRAAKIGAGVTAVSTAREAFSLLNRENFDLCILEYALPDMSGVQLCSLTRQMGSTVPMMFFSAMNRPIDLEKARLAGAIEYLSKPEDLDVLVSTVAKLLSKRRPIYSERIRRETWPRAA